MFILDSLLIGGLRFVLEKVAAAADAEAQDDSVLREQLLEVQMRLELGEISDQQFADLERDILARLREMKGDRAGFAMPAGTKISGVDVESYDTSRNDRS